MQWSLFPWLVLGLGAAWWLALGLILGWLAVATAEESHNRDIPVIRDDQTGTWANGHDNRRMNPIAGARTIAAASGKLHRS
jgi:hypothetical protein